MFSPDDGIRDYFSRQLKSYTLPSDNDYVEPTPQPRTPADAWTIPLLCAGIALIACCLLIPAADENHRLAYESAKLKLDLEQIQKQVDVNGQFLHRVADDPSLLERLAQRQMKLVRQGTSVLELDNQSSENDLSPFRLTTLPPPAELAPYRPIGGQFSALCREAHTQLYMMGIGLLLVAIGLTMDYSEPVRKQDFPELATLQTK